MAQGKAQEFVALKFVVAPDLDCMPSLGTILPEYEDEDDCELCGYCALDADGVTYHGMTPGEVNREYREAMHHLAKTMRYEGMPLAELRERRAMAYADYGTRESGSFR